MLPDLTAEKKCQMLYDKGFQIPSCEHTSSEIGALRSHARWWPDVALFDITKIGLYLEMVMSGVDDLSVVGKLRVRALK